MRASKDYTRYLRQFGATLPMRELHGHRSLAGIGLRHDVDYDLEAALALGRAEAQVGCRSTYYLLHSAAYWGKEGFGEACRELAGMGHEVALHLNVLAEWYDGKFDGLEARLGEVLETVRGTGVEVNGCAAHGDPLCYRGSFANYWMLRELRGEDPARTERGISAEGIRDERERFQLGYPESHQLERKDGQSVELWTVGMEEFGLDYHAIHVPHDRYFSDSGGSWRRTPDPGETKYEGGRWQVLMHPEYWLAPPRVIVSFGPADARQVEAAVVNQHVPVPAEGVNKALRGWGKWKFRSSSRVREVVAEVQGRLPQRADAFVYGMPEELRSLWGEEKRWERGEETEAGDGEWYPQRCLLLEPAKDEGRKALFCGLPGFRRTWGSRVRVLRTANHFAVQFVRRVRWWPVGEAVYLEAPQGSIAGRGNWRVSLEMEVERGGASLFVADGPSWRGILAPVTSRMELPVTMVWNSVLPGRTGTWRGVAKLRTGRRRWIFRYGQTGVGSQFWPAIRASAGFEGRIVVYQMRVERADDQFFAADPVLESEEVIASY